MSLTLMTYSPSSGNVCVGHEAAARAERQTLEVLATATCPAARGRHRVRGLGLRIAQRERADLRGPRRGSARAAPATRRARRRCCRSRRSNRPAAAAPRDRRRAPADRESRWRTRRDSAGAAPDGRDSAPRRRPRRATFRDTRPARSARRLRRPRTARGGIRPPRTLRTTFSSTSACAAGATSRRLRARGHRPSLAGCDSQDSTA